MGGYSGGVYDKPFAEIYVHENSTATSILTGSTYTKFNHWSANGQSYDCTPDYINNKVIIPKIGKYQVLLSASFASGTANINVLGSAFLNGDEQNNIHWRRKMATASDEATVSASGIIDVTTANWELDLRLRHDYGSNVDITITYANLSILYIGET